MSPKTQFTISSKFVFIGTYKMPFFMKILVEEIIEEKN